MLKTILRPILVAGALFAAAGAVPALADSPTPVASDSTTAASPGVEGKGTFSTDDGLATFRLAARSEVGKHGHHGDFRVEDASLSYNGAIHSYQVSGNTATIQGAGGLKTSDGQRHHVQFTLVATAGATGAGSIDVTFTGKDYNDHYAAPLASGSIVFGAPRHA